MAISNVRNMMTGTQHNKSQNRGTVKLGYNELGYNEHIFQPQMITLLHESTRL
jgi:hypothetical protein